MKKILIATVFCALSSFTLTGCDLAANTLQFDRSGNKEQQDYRDAMAPRLPDVDEGKDSAAGSSIPALQPFIANASTESASDMPLVSVTVNQSVPLRDVLFELAKQAEHDLELDPRIKGSIIFTARNRPLDEVVGRIAEISGLRYNFDNRILRVELDTPYNKTYKVDYLSYVRRNKSSVRNNLSVVSGDGADTGSQFEAAGESEANFWGELEQNLQQILGGKMSGALKTKQTPKITTAEQNPEVQAVTAPSADGQPVQVQAPQAVLKVESLPDEEDAAVAGGAPAPAPDEQAATFTINKQAGIINVYANEKAQKEISRYLDLLRTSVTSQVLIEAKILEVALTDEYATGINWRAVDIGDGAINYLTSAGNGLLNSLSESTSNQPTNLTGANTLSQNSGLVVGYTGDDVEALIQALQGFGTVKALASPRMTVLNNQSAVLNVATNRVFFEIDVEVTTQDNNTNTDIDSDIRNVPEGVLVNVQPSINLDNNTISLAVRPTVTRIVAEKPDPAIQFVTATADPPITNVQSLIPELNVQEIDSVIKVRSGQPIVMGGLLQDRTISRENGIPVLSEAPMLGNLFRQQSDSIRKTELVIFLKATILDSPGESISDTDKDLYRNFSEDRRPLRF